MGVPDETPGERSEELAEEANASEIAYRSRGGNRIM